MEIGDQIKVEEIEIPANITKVTSADAVAIFIEKAGEKIELEEEAVEAVAEPVVEATEKS